MRKLKKLKLNRNFYLLLVGGLIFLSGLFVFDRSLADDDELGIVITEVMYDPDGRDDYKEWIEVYNNSNEDIDLEDLKIRDIKDEEDEADSRGHGLEIFNTKDFVLKSGEYGIVAENGEVFKSECEKIKKEEFVGKIFRSSIDLKNDNGLIILVLNKKESRMKYNEGMGGDDDGYSLELDKGGFFRGSVDVGGSPGEENPEKEEIIDDEDDENDDSNNNSETIRINEFLPNPVGNDEEGEYIELYNFSNKSVDLCGWFLGDSTKANKHKIENDCIISGGEFLVVYRKDSDIALNNTNNESVFLLDSDENEIDKVDYNGSKEGYSYGFDEKKNKWRWSVFLTPGAENVFKDVGEVEIDIDEDIYRGIYADFKVEVGGMKDKEMKVRWEFGDGRKSYLAKTRHKYEKTGKYTVKLKFFNGEEDVNKEFKIEVENFPKQKVRINAVNPNPAGIDSENEWIEIKNKEKKKVNLKNWSIATGSDKKKMVNHPIYEDFIIKPGKTKILTREYSNFSLNNKKCYIELRYPNGKVAYKLKYKSEKSIGEENIYGKKDGGGWEWVVSDVIIPEEDLEADENQVEIVIVEDDELDVPELSLEDVGKFSAEEWRDKIREILESYWMGELENQSNQKEKYVLGAMDDKMKKIRLEDGIYYFNPKGKTEKHWLVKWWEDVF